MNRHSQRGVALVITLVMLSVVTFMAVVFLGVSRRERASVKVTEDQTSARLMADTALARAQAEVIGGIFGASNRFNYDFKVSTNFINYDGFRAANGTRYTNVSYNYPNGTFVTGNDLLQNLANLYIDPRPPVFVPPADPTDPNGVDDFRYYLDLNRNGRFESNGYLPFKNINGDYLRTNGTPTTQLGGDLQTNHYMGDPEWIGTLERPDRPHSSSNRFVGRYAFVIQPAGKSLDLNFIHNSVREDSDAPMEFTDFYSRNQGFGSWEINLAAFFAQLNTNRWLFNAADYLYRGTQPGNPNAGITFNDATALLGYRYNTNYASPLSARDYFGNFFGDNRARTAFLNDWIDGYGDGPFYLGIGLTNYTDDIFNDGWPWPGSDSPNTFTDPQQLFSLKDYSDPFTEFNERFTNMMSFPRQGTEDRYTFYRLLSQMGVESQPAWENKINLNYKNIDDQGIIRPYLATNFVPWEPLTFFTNTAHALLRATMTNQIIVNGANRTTNFYLGATDVPRDFGIHNIEISNGQGVTNDNYSAAVHRLLQVSANIYDATTNRVMTPAGTFPTNLPSVFRPTYMRVGNRVYVNGYVEVTNNVDFLNNEWVDITTNINDLAEGSNNINHVNVHGMPLIIGAREGYPNFNELEIQTAVQITRKLQVIKPSATAAPFLTNQMFLIGISNSVGLEAWNSYFTNNYGRRLELRATNYFTLTLSNRTQVLRTFNVVSPFLTNIAAGDWKSNQFIIPIQTNLITVPSSILRASSGLQTDTPSVFSRLTESPLSVQNGNNAPRLDLWITNRLTYILIDVDSGRRIVDYVSLNNQTVYLDLIKELRGNPSNLSQVESVMGSMWLPNTVSGFPGLEEGALNQILASLGNTVLSQTHWDEYNYQTQDKDRSIDRFRVFVGLTPFTYSVESMRNELGNSTSIETPFNPTRKLIHRTSWQVNDPLVHYTADDLRVTNYTYIAGLPQGSDTNSNIGRMNDRYSPWLGNPNKSDVAGDVRQQDPLIYRSSDWDFPTNRFPNIGWLGRVHRGTPWQTLYFKSASAVFTNANMGAISARDWSQWAGRADTHPTNDWLFAELFTVAPNENASRGLLSVNQYEPAAWAAVLSGVSMVTNNTSVSGGNLSKYTEQRYGSELLEPGSEQFHDIWRSITNARARFPNGRFPHMGAVLAAPELTVNSPFLNRSPDHRQYTINDVAYERIPQQILSLLKEDEPRVVIYAYGQALKPAPDSLVRTPGPYFQICTNYQITGEVATKTVIRFEGPVENMRAVVESYNVIPTE